MIRCVEYCVKLCNQQVHFASTRLSSKLLIAMSSATFLTNLLAEQPDLTEHLLALQDLHSRRLWHQLTVKLEFCFQDSQFNQGDLPARIFQSFVLDFAHKINILKLAHFAVGRKKVLK